MSASSLDDGALGAGPEDPPGVPHQGSPAAEPTQDLGFTVHARSSYRAEEIRRGRRFADMFGHDGDSLAVDVDKLSDTVGA